MEVIVFWRREKQDKREKTKECFSLWNKRKGETNDKHPFFHWEETFKTETTQKTIYFEKREYLKRESKKRAEKR